LKLRPREDVSQPERVAKCWPKVAPAGQTCIDIDYEALSLKSHAVNLTDTSLETSLNTVISRQLLLLHEFLLSHGDPLQKIEKLVAILWAKTGLT